MTPDLFGYPDTPGAKVGGTSEEAAQTVSRTAPILRAIALDVLERSNGLTADEVAGRLGMSILSIRPRISELLRLHKIRDSGTRRRNVSGRRAIVWVPVFPARLKGQRK